MPARLRSQLGYRLKQGLGTKSLLAANVLKKPVVKAFKDRIAKAWEGAGGARNSEPQEAVKWAKLLAEAGEPGDAAYDYLAQTLREREAEIEAKGARYEIVEDEDGDATARGRRW